MPGKDFSDVRAAPGPPVNWQGLLGYLNYAEGRPDPRFQGQLHAAYLLAADQARGGNVVPRLADLLDEQLTALHRGGAAAFREIGQARLAIRAALRDLPPAYRQHHRDYNREHHRRLTDRKCNRCEQSLRRHHQLHRYPFR